MPSEACPPTDHSKSPIEASAAVIETQCVIVKREVYKLKALIESHPHQENRLECLRQWEVIYDGFQALQSFITSR
jgi:hypothetical protein